MTFEDKLSNVAGLIEERLSFVIDSLEQVPPHLLQAVRHSLMGGGKRFRPFLVLESAALFGIDDDAAMRTALAVECIHCYSLVHDDLPFVDNARLRRGGPSVWAAYGDWTALLVGDGLQALAFQLLSDQRFKGLEQSGLSQAPQAQIWIQLIEGLARAAGLSGMVGGQALDLASDKLGKPDDPDVEYVRCVQGMKTGALLIFSAEAGAILSGRDDRFRCALREYGRQVGFAFQMSDDLLDAQGCARAIGKAVAQDEASGKITLVSLCGIDEVKRMLKEAEAAAHRALALFGSEADLLREAASFVVRRGW